MHKSQYTLSQEQHVAELELKAPTRSEETQKTGSILKIYHSISPVNRETSPGDSPIPQLNESISHGDYCSMALPLSNSRLSKVNRSILEVNCSI